MTNSKSGSSNVQVITIRYLTVVTLVILSTIVTAQLLYSSDLDNTGTFMSFRQADLSTVCITRSLNLTLPFQVDLWPCNVSGAAFSPYSISPGHEEAGKVMF